MVTLPDKTPRHSEYTQYLARRDVNLAHNTSLGNAPELAAWIDWLKHPEEHNGTRLCTAPNGERQESYGNLQNPNNHPPGGQYIDDTDPETLPDRNGVRYGHDYYLPYESVIEKMYIAQLLGPQAAVATQHVERPEAPFAGVIAVLTEIIWRIDDFNFRLADTPDKIGAWDGEAGRRYGESVAAMCDLNTKMQELIDGFIPRVAEYVALMKRTREGLNHSTGKTVEKFKEAIPDPIDLGAVVFKWVLGLVFNTANASGKALTVGTKDPLSKVAKNNAVGLLWDAVVGGLLGMINASSEDYQQPPTFAEMTSKYLANQDKILTDATKRMKELTTDVEDLQRQLAEARIPTLPEE